VVSFCDQIEAMKAAGLCPHLQYVGVVASRYTAHHNVVRAERATVQDELRIRQLDCGFLPNDMFIPQTVSIVGHTGIAYFGLYGSQPAANAKRAITCLAEHVARQMGVPEVPSFKRDDQLAFPVAAE
jgi:hypothetical protein